MDVETLISVMCRALVITLKRSGTKHSSAYFRVFVTKRFVKDTKVEYQFGSIVNSNNNFSHRTAKNGTYGEQFMEVNLGLFKR